MPYAACSPSYQPAPRPSSTRPPLIASACATWIASGPGRRNVTGVTSVPSRIREVSRPSAASVIHASVEPGAERPFADAQVVVGAEERVEAELLGELRDREELVVGRALLRFGEDPQFHARGRYPASRDEAVGDGAVITLPQVLSVERWPELSEPLMVIALAGWVDAGGAGAGAMSALAEQLEDAETFGTIDLVGRRRSPADPPRRAVGGRRARHRLAAASRSRAAVCPVAARRRPRRRARARSRTVAALAGGRVDAWSTRPGASACGRR